MVDADGQQLSRGRCDVITCNASIAYNSVNPGLVSVCTLWDLDSKGDLLWGPQ